MLHLGFRVELQGSGQIRIPHSHAGHEGDWTQGFSCMEHGFRVQGSTLAWVLEHSDA